MIIRKIGEELLIIFLSGIRVSLKQKKKKKKYI